MRNTKQETCRKTGHIFVVDDDPVSLRNLRRILEKDGHQAHTYSNPLRALNRLEKEPCDLLITDLKMPYMKNGLDLFKRAQRAHPSLEGIIITGYASLEGAVGATKDGQTIRPGSVERPRRSGFGTEIPSRTPEQGRDGSE